MDVPLGHHKVKKKKRLQTGVCGLKPPIMRKNGENVPKKYTKLTKFCSLCFKIFIKINKLHYRPQRLWKGNRKETITLVYSIKSISSLTMSWCVHCFQTPFTEVFFNKDPWMFCRGFSVVNVPLWMFVMVSQHSCTQGQTDKYHFCFRNDDRFMRVLKQHGHLADDATVFKQLALPVNVE